MSGSGPGRGVLLVHPGTQHAFRLARELASRELLSAFWTGLAIHREQALFPMLQNLLPSRVIDGVPRAAVHTRPWMEFVAQAALRAGADPQRTFYRRNRRFQAAIPGAAFHQAGAVLGFDTSSWILAERARAAGIPLLLDRSAPPPPDDLFARLVRRFPDWHADFEPRDVEVARAERVEHESARCISVASSFTRNLLTAGGVPEAKIRVIPYGVDAEWFAPGSEGARGGGRIRFLYAGLVNARKGVPLLLEAWRALGASGKATLTLVGQADAARRALLRGLPGVTLAGRVPHTEMRHIYAAHDVLVFPSYHDGFGLVILEAMAAGLPVIASAASAGPDLISEGEDGFVVSPGDGAGLAERLQSFAANPGRAPEMGRAAREKARRYSWASYGTAWARLLETQGVA